MTGQHRPRARPSSDAWVAAVYQEAGEAKLLGAGFLIDTRRVLTCAHVVHTGGQPRGDLWVALPKADELMHRRLRVERVMAPPPDDQELKDVAVLVLAEEVAPEYVARLRRPAAGDLVDGSWWSFGFPDGMLGNSAAGAVGESLGYGWVRLDTDSRYPVKAGFSGAALWSADYDAVVGLVGQARRDSGDARALSLRAVDLALPEQNLSLLTDWSVEAAGDGALAAWGWRLAGDAESGRHWHPRARGVSTEAERGFRFRGRHAALKTLVEWIDTPGQDRRQVLVVTGSPGVGKSAVLGRVVTTADAQIAAALPAGDTAVRAPVGSVACAVHARDKTALEVAHEIARAASAPLPERAKELPDLLRRALEDDTRGGFCVVLDALDEAATPEHARAILLISIALAETCADLDVRVVVGSRQVDGAGDLLAPHASALKIVDLDLPEYFAPEDLIDYALATLQLVGDERVDSPYADGPTAAAVAERIAAMARGNFLIAGLVARAHGMHDNEPVQVDRLRYSMTVETALRDYLARLPGLQGMRAEDLLTALAYAESPGLTLELWQSVVQTMTGRLVDERDLHRFVRSAAANFLVESSGTTSRTGSFRLFHQALNEALLRHRGAAVDPAEDERAIARALIHAAGSQWATAPGYLLRSLPGHAVRGGIIDELLADDAYPLHADLRRLVPAAKSAQSAAGRARARLLRKTPQALAAGPTERAALFSVTETREHLGHSYRGQHRLAPYQAVWAVGAPHAEEILLEGHTDWINALCAVPVKGRLHLASASNDATVRLWDVDTGETVRIFASHSGPVRALASFPDRHRALLAGADSDDRIQLWHPDTGHTVRTLKGHTAYVNALASVPWAGQTVLASASNDATVRLWDVDTGETVRVLAGHSGPVRALASFTDREQALLATAGTDGTIRLWDVRTSRCQRILATDTGWVNALCAVRVAGRTLLAGAGNSQQIHLWDPRTGSVVREVTHHTEWVRAVAALPGGDDTVVASAGHDTSVRLWDGRSGQAVRDGFDGHTDWVTSLCVLSGADHTLLASAGNDNAIRLWDTQAAPATADTDPVIAVTAVCALVEDSRTLIASAESDHRVCLRDASTGEAVTMLAGYDDWVRAMCVLEVDGQLRLATGGDDRHIRLWNATTGAVHRSLTGHADAVTALCPVTLDERRLLASASHDNTVRLWDPSFDARCLAVVACDSTALAMATLVVGGQLLLAVGYEDGAVRLWDPRDRLTVRVWEGHFDAVTTLVAVDTDGHTLLATASDDRTVRLWHPATGQEVHRFDGHTGRITALATMSAGGRTRLVSASDDRTLRVWDPAAQDPPVVVPSHSAAWSAATCGELVVVGLSDGLLALSFERTT
ncbi:AAA family ATPase [Kitasatospora purpeofusca]|uniref:AAA family ATPase n=1 Tax=Kitasatospora purpeofusca TaxID=67352 RepID=UPI003F4AE714